MPDDVPERPGGGEQDNLLDIVGLDPRGLRLHPVAREVQRKIRQRSKGKFTKLHQSADGTRRYLLRLEDGRTVETVLMPEGERDTICISSQVGCPVDCKFCMTALLGLERSLSAGEIVGQVLTVARDNRRVIVSRR